VEGQIKGKNIFILLLFFLLGFFTHVAVINWGNIDISPIMSSLNRETVIEEVVESEEVADTVCTPAQEDKDKVKQEEDPCPVLVDISGAVSTPGVYCFADGASIIDAVKRANGFTQDAGFKYISMKMNLSAEMKDNSKVYIPFENDYNCNLLAFSLPKEVVDIINPPQESNDDVNNGDSTNDGGCISINNATLQELETLNGVGPSTAQKIIDGRPYSKIEDLLNVSGIGEATLNKFKDSICL
jgi:competence protein ComEA